MPESWTTEGRLYFAVVVGMTTTAIICVVGIIILSFVKAEIPASLNAIAGTALGAVAGLLVRVPKASDYGARPRE